MEKTITVASTQVFVEGTGQSTIVMLHGWPDTHESWRQQIDYFKAQYVCVSFTMPGFSRDDHSKYSVTDVVERIREIVDAVSPGDKVILLAHDWGCVFGYEYAMRYSDRVEKMIGMDVGDADSKDFQDSLSITQKLMVFTYQIILAISFVPVLPRELSRRQALPDFLGRCSDYSHVYELRLTHRLSPAMRLLDSEWLRRVHPRICRASGD